MLLGDHLTMTINAIQILGAQNEPSPSRRVYHTLMRVSVTRHRVYIADALWFIPFSFFAFFLTGRFSFLRAVPLL